jgi:hypothetical protein
MLVARRKGCTLVRPIDGITLCVFLWGLFGALTAVSQTQQVISRTIAITSSPPGATIWTKEGRTFTCTNQLTPAAVEMKFHGQNDVKQVVLRRFGYYGQKLSLDATHETAAADLSRWDEMYFAPPDDASPQIRQLDGKLRGAFEAEIIAGKDAFPCSPYNFLSIGVVDSGERHQLELGVFLEVGPSATAKNLNAASKSHSASEPERLSSLGRAVLDGGLAEIVGRFRGVAARFPEIKGLFLACSFSTNEAYLDTKVTRTSTAVEVNNYGQAFGEGASIEQLNDPLRSNIEYREHTYKETIVKDQKTEETLTIAVPLSSIPPAGNAKDVTDAVISNGTVRVYRENR